jgi:hypothetical protein
MPAVIRAQTDNFDSYTTVSGFTAAGWVISEMDVGYTTTTFPAVDTGKGLRMQAYPIPADAPAVGIWSRTNQYANFYMAVDIVGWADTNQAVVLLARGSLTNSPIGATGYLANYNVTEWGDAPTNARQGELQISILYPSFTTVQLAIGEFTLNPGGSYRMVFSGVGFQFKVQVYDLLDLTKPLIQMVGNDANSTYTNGVCGLMAFSRNDETGTADITVDNYFVGASDPNPASAPALAHPVAGTPAITTRTPTNRFSNFFAPTGGMSFTARTYTTNVINASATKLRLNGVNVSSQLVLSSNGTNISGSLPGSALNSNTVYGAQIEVQDVSGLKKSTNTFWFDTFSDAYFATANIKIIEAEDYNYSNGVYQIDPIAVSGPDTNGNPVAGNGIGYSGLHGVEGVDFHDTQTNAEPEWAGEFRQFDPVGLSQGMYPEIQDSNDPFGETRYSDYVRTQYVANQMLEFVVHRTAPGEWLNYTRVFNTNSYNAWLRVASFGASTVMLDRVTKNPALPGQTTTNLGKFSIPNQFARYNYRYIPLVDNAGSPVALNLSGTMTLRLTMAGTPGQDNDKLAINYILFVPTIHLLSSPTVVGPYSEEPAATVDAGGRTITVAASGAKRFYKLSSGTALTITNLSVSGGIVRMKY